MQPSDLTVFEMHSLFDSLRALVEGMHQSVADTASDDQFSLASLVSAGTGETHFPRRIADRLSERNHRSSLSAREVQILELLSKGLTNKDIGRALDISQFTVRNHVNRILAKLEVSDRTEASTVALEKGILPSVLRSS